MISTLLRFFRTLHAGNGNPLGNAGDRSTPSLKPYTFRRFFRAAHQDRPPEEAFREMLEIIQQDSGFSMVAIERCREGCQKMALAQLPHLADRF